MTPDMLKGMAAWPASVALLVVSALAMFVATTCYLRFVHGWDRAVGIARRESWIDGAGDGAVGGVRRRPARHRDRACHAGAADRDRPAGGPCAVRARRSRRSRRCGSRCILDRRACHPAGGVEPGGGHPAASAVSRRSHVRRARGLRPSCMEPGSSRHAAVVARQRRRDHARCGRRRALCQYQPATAAELSRRRLRLVRGRGSRSPRALRSSW